MVQLGFEPEVIVVENGPVPPSHFTVTVIVGGMVPVWTTGGVIVRLMELIAALTIRTAGPAVMVCGTAELSAMVAQYCVLLAGAGNVNAAGEPDVCGLAGDVPVTFVFAEQLGFVPA